MTAQREHDPAPATSPRPPVSEVGMRDIGGLLEPASCRRQSLRGFDPEYADIVDYIIRCTHRIWEEKAVGLIYTHYRHNAVVHTPYGATQSRDAVVTDTVQTLHAFPDRRLYGDDVVWSGDDVRGFYTSHRITNVMTNLGPTMFGPATGRRVVVRGIADCVVFENRIVEEWLVRDNLHLVRQLGFDPHDVARALAERDAQSGVTAEVFGEVERVAGQTTPPEYPPPTGDGFDVQHFIESGLHQIWNWRFFNIAREQYSPTASIHVPPGQTLYGPDAYIGFAIALLAALPDAALRFDHLCALGDDRTGFRAALRWTLVGTHLGHGPFGPPSGRRVTIMGITHVRIQDGRIQEEWTVFDQLAVLKQIHLMTP